MTNELCGATDGQFFRERTQDDHAVVMMRRLDNAKVNDPSIRWSLALGRSYDCLVPIETSAVWKVKYFARRADHVASCVQGP